MLYSLIFQGCPAMSTSICFRMGYNPLLLTLWSQLSFPYSFAEGEERRVCKSKGKPAVNHCVQIDKFVQGEKQMFLKFISSFLVTMR